MWILQNGSLILKCKPRCITMSFTSTLILFALVGSVFGVLVNRTIDDQFGDPTTGVMPTYHPEANWTQVTNCSGCWAKLDRTLLFNGTCHDSTYFPGVGDQTPHTMTFSFYGALGLSTALPYAIHTFHRISHLYLLRYVAPNSWNHSRNPPQYHSRWASSRRVQLHSRTDRLLSL